MGILQGITTVFLPSFSRVRDAELLRLAAYTNPQLLSKTYAPLFRVSYAASCSLKM